MCARHNPGPGVDRDASKSEPRPEHSVCLRAAARPYSSACLPVANRRRAAPRGARLAFTPRRYHERGAGGWLCPVRSSLRQQRRRCRRNCFARARSRGARSRSATLLLSHHVLAHMPRRRSHRSWTARREAGGLSVATRCSSRNNAAARRASTRVLPFLKRLSRPIVGGSASSALGLWEWMYPRLLVMDVDAACGDAVFGGRRSVSRSGLGDGPVVHSRLGAGVSANSCRAREWYVGPA